ncbi:hypothetical protein GVAV_001025 [Gurleya vavrai]
MKEHNFKIAINELEDADLERLYINLDANDKKTLISVLYDENKNLERAITELEEKNKSSRVGNFIILDDLWDITPSCVKKELAMFFETLYDEIKNL